MNTEPELQIVTPAESKLIAFAQQTGLEQTSTAPLVAAFRPLFIEARAILAACEGVAAAVKDATCVSEIKKARACRLALRKVRIAAEKVKKDQKANALAYGRAVDGFYNILCADIDPVEGALQDAEDTAERAETARKDAIEAGRKTALAPFVADVSLYAVRDMAEPAFTALLTGVRVAKEQSEAAAAKAEAERIEKEKAEAAERERIRQENERLRSEAIAREAAAKAEREAAEKKLAQERAEAAKLAAETKAKADAEARAASAKAEMEKAEIEAKAKAEREKIQAQRKAEQDAAFAQAEQTRKKVEAEHRKLEAEKQKAEAEARALRDAEAKRIEAEAESRRKAEAAPDREKLLAYANAISDFERPDLATTKGRIAGEEIDSEISSLVRFIRSKAAAI